LNFKVSSVAFALVELVESGVPDSVAQPLSQVELRIETSNKSNFLFHGLLSFNASVCLIFEKAIDFVFNKTEAFTPLIFMQRYDLRRCVTSFLSFHFTQSTF
jgi:hypothetical protein